MELKKYAMTLFGLFIISGVQVALAGDIGKSEYDANCAVCHGPDGKGKGPFVSQLTIQPPDLTLLAKKNGGVFPASRIFNLIDGREDMQAHGPRDMPIWGESYLTDAKGPSYDSFLKREEFVRARILALTDYLARLQQK